MPPTRTHRHATIIAGIGSFFDLFDIFLAGVLSTVLTQQFALDRLWLPAALSSAFVGMFIGAIVLGRLADRVGRRTAFLLNLGIYSAFTLAGAFSVNAPMLIVSRFLAGIGIGAELTLVDAYLSELLPSRLRGRYTAWAYTIGFLGVPAAGLLGRILVPLEPFGIEGWRWLFVAGSLGAVIVWFVRRRLPESPRWLESVGRIAEADAIVREMESEAALGGPLLTSNTHETTAASNPSRAGLVLQTRQRLWVLLGGEYRSRAVMLGVFHVFQTVGYYGFGTLVPLVLASKGYSIVTSLTFVTLTFIGYPIGSALSLPIIERVDRKWLIVSSAFLMSVLGIGMGYATSPAAIVAFGFLVHGRQQRVLECPARLPGRDLSDVREGHGGRHLLWPEPPVERRDALRPAPGARPLGRRSDVRCRRRRALDRDARHRPLRPGDDRPIAGGSERLG